MDSTSRLMSVIASSGFSASDTSRATSPGADYRMSNGDEDDENLPPRRPRTFPYLRYLPYEIEDDSTRLFYLNEILKQLYIAVESENYSAGATYWTRELRGWIGLKLDLPRDTRIRLVKLYYELALAPGIESSVSERFASTFMVLTKRKHYLRPGKDLFLDWRPLLNEFKLFVLPEASGSIQATNFKRNIRTLVKLCTFAQLYFDPREVPQMFEDLLPYFNTSNAESAYIVVGLLNLLMPTTPPADTEEMYPQSYLPMLFHLWSLINRSKTFDSNFLDIFSRLARDSLAVKEVPFSGYGIYTKEQSQLIFTAILRLLDIPVGQATSAYSSGVDSHAGMSMLIDRDQRKHPIAHNVARWIIMSLSPAALEDVDSILGNLEGLIQAVETFFHPSNSGGWTKILAQLLYYLADFFVMRWNREQSGEMDLPEERKLNDAVKRRFVLCLRDATFMGIYAKSGTAMNYSLSTLQNLAFLEPHLILPGALQRIYPSMQGLVEVHRTISSIRSLQVLSRILIRTKGYRCHVTTMLGLTLPGIDANDLEKTLQTLSYIQSVCYGIPFHDLTKGREDVQGSSVAAQWISQEVDNLERQGVNVELDYDTALSDHDEAILLRSSTANFGEFLTSLLGRVFTLLENLPDPSRMRSGSPEENVVNTLPATFTPLLASLSPELYDIALNKVADFVANHVIHQARDAMAFICNALCKVQPEKALKRFVPFLISAIRTEIDENGAASTRTTGSDVLPRDRGLVWHISMLSMCVVHVGPAVLNHKQELFDIAQYLQQNCKGIPTVHVSNFIHHMLLNLTSTYTTDYALYEPDVLARGLDVDDWGRIPQPTELKIKWHVPTSEEIQFAIEIFQTQAKSAIDFLDSLIGGNPPVKRDGTGKEWSDEISRNLVLLRLLLSGVSVLFDPETVSGQRGTGHDALPNGDTENSGPDSSEASGDFENNDMLLSESDDQEIRPRYKYATGRSLDYDSTEFQEIHQMRIAMGELLHRVHQFLTQHQEDDVSCFNALYSSYRTWFIDVGIERSAHVLDRVTRLLSADIQPFMMSGTRKQYPRPLLLRRAHVYHLQRLRHNASTRPSTDLDRMLLLDLAESCMSLYTDIRRTTQLSAESAVKAIIGGRPLIIPSLLKSFEHAVAKNDHARIKGGICTLLFGSLSKTIGRDWRYAPSLIRSFIEVSANDKPSIQKMAAGASYTVLDFSHPTDRIALVNKEIVKSIAPAENLDEIIEEKRTYLRKKRDRIEDKKSELSEELIDMVRESHWKKATRSAALIANLAIRFELVATNNMVDLVAKGTIDSHPNLRGIYSGALVTLFSVVELRALSEHNYEKFLRDISIMPSKREIETGRDDPEWTKTFVSSFAQPKAEHYVDQEHYGWLVWPEKMAVYETKPSKELEYDENESRVRATAGAIMTKEWFATFFKYLKQEPRDSHADRFRMATALMLMFAFDLVLDGAAVASFEDIKELAAQTYEDGSDKHQHRAMSEILGALLVTVNDKKAENRDKVWEYVFPIVQKIFDDGLTPENFSYWNTFLYLVVRRKDPRRVWPFMSWLADFRLDLLSNAAFKESSKINMLQQCISDAGWHFQLEKPIVEDFLAHLDHPYKGVREAMGQTLSTIFRTRYHESFKSVQDLIAIQREASSLGKPAYTPTPEFAEMFNEIFARLEKWRHERTPGQQSSSSYTSGSKTVLLWLDSTLSSYECTQLVKFFPTSMMTELLHMMDIKEDPELQSLAYLVFRHLPNIPHQSGEDAEFINALIRIGQTSPLWHQRLRVLINMQVIYFRQLFLISEKEQQALFDCVSRMLEDSQLEVRLGASTTLSGMIRCSPLAFRNDTVRELQNRFSEMLRKSPMPKRPAHIPGSNSGSSTGTGTGTPTPEHNRLIISRHAAVLGLGALVQAFPYASPPPPWLPEVLATLARKAAADPGMVGKSAKSILSDFKKTRQDTWHVDVKAFTTEQLEDLEGVLWKSYFA